VGCEGALHCAQAVHADRPRGLVTVHETILRVGSEEDRSNIKIMTEEIRDGLIPAGDNGADAARKGCSANAVVDLAEELANVSGKIGPVYRERKRRVCVSHQGHLEGGITDIYRENRRRRRLHTLAGGAGPRKDSGASGQTTALMMPFLGQ